MFELAHWFDSGGGVQIFRLGPTVGVSFRIGRLESRFVGYVYSYLVQGRGYPHGEERGLSQRAHLAGEVPDAVAMGRLRGLVLGASPLLVGGVRREALKLRKVHHDREEKRNIFAWLVAACRLTASNRLRRSAMSSLEGMSTEINNHLRCFCGGVQRVHSEQPPLRSDASRQPAG